MFVCTAAACGLLSAPRVGAVHWLLAYGRRECLSTGIAQNQWDYIMESSTTHGQLEQVDPKTALMELTVDLGLIVYTPDRLQLPDAAVDYELLHPNGTILERRYHVTEQELHLNAYGPKGPFTACFEVAQTGKWHPKLLVQVTHFTVNHASLVNSRVAHPRTTMPEINATSWTSTSIAPAADVAEASSIATMTLLLDQAHTSITQAGSEIRHRVRLMAAHLDAARAQARHLVQWLAVVNLALVVVTGFQVLVIRWMFRESGSTGGGYVTANRPPISVNTKPYGLPPRRQWTT